MHASQIRSVILSSESVADLLGHDRSFLSMKVRGKRGHKVGDVLWVKETYDEVHPIGVQPGRFTREGRAGIPAFSARGGGAYRVIYRADAHGDALPYWHCSDFPFRTLSPKDDFDRKNWPRGFEGGWYPSMMMPVYASRFTLVVTDAARDGDHLALWVEVHAENLDDYLDRTGAYDGMIGTPTYWHMLPKSPAYRAWLQKFEASRRAA